MKVIVSVAGERIGVASFTQPGDYCVGRHAGSSLHLSHPTVSARHATLHWDGARVAVLDDTIGERTWLDGAPFCGWRDWSPGTTLRLGAVILELVSGDGEEASFAVSLSPLQAPLGHDPHLPPTSPLPAIPEPKVTREERRWERWLAASAASVAAAAAAWIALFW